MILACEYCLGFESAVAGLAALPLVFHYLWHKIRNWRNPWMVYDAYHNTLVPRWFSSKKQAECEAAHATKETGRLYEIQRIPHGKN
jgi:hypothetical protein